MIPTGCAGWPAAIGIGGAHRPSGSQTDRVHRDGERVQAAATLKQQAIVNTAVQAARGRGASSVVPAKVDRVCPGGRHG